MPPVNPMMAALQQSRQDNPVSSSGPMPGGAPQQAQGQNPDLAKYWSMMQDMNSKLDKVIEFISGSQTGKNPSAPQSEENDGNEEKENYKHGSAGY